MINYEYFQAEGVCVIGGGCVESWVKQIDRRVQISGASWHPRHAPQVLAQCRYGALFWSWHPWDTLRCV